MASKPVRVAGDLALWAESYAKQRGVTASTVVSEALRNFKELAESGVPDLPAPDTPEVRRERVKLSERQRAEQEFRAAIGARQERLNEEKARNLRSGGSGR